MIKHWKGTVAVLMSLAMVSFAIAGSGTITVKDSAGATKTYVVVTDGSGNFVGVSVICDYSSAANCVTVDSSHRLSVLSNQPTASNLNMTEASASAILSAVQGPVPAGTNLVGKVGIDQTTPGTTNLVAAGQVSQYPIGAVPITASNTGTTAATTATLTNVSGHTTYICGYSVRANATAAATVTDTVTGVITATMSSTLWVAPLASGLGVDEQIFIPCIPASAVSTSIAVVSGAPGTGGVVSVKAWGYSL